MNLLPKALPKKCHRLHRASKFPEASPVKSALHYICPTLTLLSVSVLPFSLFHQLIFFLLTFRERSCQKLLRSIILLCMPPKHSSNQPSFGCVRLTKSEHIAIDLLCLREEKSRNRGERTPLQLRAQSI